MVWVRELMDHWIATFGYGGLAAVMFLENVIPPIPSEAVLPFAGFLVAEGRMNLALVLLFTTAGAFLGTTVFYMLGRSLGDARVRYLFRRYGRYVLLREADYDEALTLFRNHDAKVVFWARFVPAVRSLISLPAGIAGMPFRRFAAYTLAGTLIWNLVLVTAGLFLGQHWTTVLHLVEQLEALLWVLLIATVVGWFVWQRRRRRRRTEPAVAETSVVRGD